MSANLMWEPAKRNAGTLSDGLKFVLRDKYGLTSERRTFGNEQINYLAGLWIPFATFGLALAVLLFWAIKEKGAHRRK